MKTENHTGRNLIVWGIVGLLVGGPLGAIVAVLVYIAFD
jgi:hypothetical protein